MIRLVLFWAGLAVAVWTWLGFPLVVLARAHLRPRPHLRRAIEPRVSIVLAARNEASAIGDRLENLLSLDYPSDRLEIIVASDGSEDATVEVIRRFEPRGVQLLDLPHVGKAQALSAAVEASGGEIIVFTDANTRFEPDAVRQLVASFADPTVGGVAGDQRYLPAGATAPSAGVGERHYWDFDRLLKRAESRAGNVISATGAIYAVRRPLVRPIPEGVTDDFITSTAVIAAGRRLVFEPAAVAWEPVATSDAAEFGRKVRIMTRSLHGLVLARELLDPRRTGFYAVQLFSHKVLRRLTAYPLLVMAVVIPALWRRGALYRLALLAEAAVLGLGTAGLVAPRSLAHLRVLALPAFFLRVSAASIQATWNVARGRTIVHWEPERPSTLAREPEGAPVRPATPATRSAGIRRAAR